MPCAEHANWHTFQLTRLMRGVTTNMDKAHERAVISTHTPHARRDADNLMLELGEKISTHTPHARRDDIFVAAHFIFNISTHTTHARRDLRRNSRITLHCYFNSHASCEA